MKLFEEFKLYENLFEDATVGKEHTWMKDVPLKYPELNMGSNPEDDILIKDFTYLEGPEDVAEVLDTLITEEDVAGTGYDFQTIKTDCDAWYDFLDANFDKLVTKYDEELLNAFEDRAIKAAISEAEDDYYNGNSEYIHESPEQPKEDNLARMRRQIRDEIAGYEIEKAFDPDNAYDYDEKIEACKAELARLASLAPSKATLKRRAIKAEQEEKIKEIERRLRWAFKGLFKYFGHPHCKVSKDGSWLIIFRRLTPMATTEAIDICAKAGLQIKYSTEHSDMSSAFRLDIDNLDINNSSFAWLDGIDTDAIKARLEAEQNKSNTNNKTEMNEQKLRSVDKMKLHEEFRLYETLWDEPNTTDTVIITADSLGEKIIVAKKDLALAKKLDRKACDIWDSAEERYQDEDELCARLGISAFSGVEIFDKLAAEACLEWDLAEWEALDKKGSSSGLNEWKAAANKPQQSLTWEELLEKADELLVELSTVSGNEDYDDGDGYWQEEYTVWCNRYLYYSDTLNNSNKLDKLCDVYSNKLPNVEFYYVEYEDICEIGYTATRE